MSAKRRARKVTRLRPQPRKQATAVDGSLLGQQVLLQSLQGGHAEQPGLGAVLTLRVRGVNDQGRPTVLTLGVAEADIDQVMAAIQQGAADFREWRAQEDM
jgi:hypothetical protein